jgi:GTP-binding protein HflX
VIELNNNKTETAILVGVSSRKVSQEEVMFSLDELEKLVETAGGEVVEKVVQAREYIDTTFFIGKGKAIEITEICNDKDIDIIVFDDELSPVQIRNLENITKKKVTDRSAVILEIFASNARTVESKTEVELAQLEYLLPRLTRRWTHFSKQFGGFGSKGPGETQIETDRRMIKVKISALKEKLEIIKRQKETQRKQRSNLPRLALVGYTNAGKSTIMNILTNAGVLAENKLFSTLDTIVRRVALSPSREFLISDTVGFIKKLPHHLIVSFLSTLSEAVESDILLHVVDISDIRAEDNIAVVNDTLKKLNCAEKPIVMIFNKIDILNNRDIINYYKEKYKNSVFISAARSIGVNSFVEEMLSVLDLQLKDYEIKVDINDQKYLSSIYELAKVTELKYKEKYIKVKFLTTEQNYKNILKISGG